jgi:hypothetical protein
MLWDWKRVEEAWGLVSWDVRVVASPTVADISGDIRGERGPVVLCYE